MDAEAQTKGSGCHEARMAPTSSLVCDGCRYGKEIVPALAEYAEGHEDDWAALDDIEAAIEDAGCKEPAVITTDETEGCGQAFVKVCRNPVVRMLIQNYRVAQQHAVQEDSHLLK